MPPAEREAPAATEAAAGGVTRSPTPVPRETPPAAEAAARSATGPGRVVVGEDDVLADVDTGVNEDEFKW